jgi:hypothetical protein
VHRHRNARDRKYLTVNCPCTGASADVEDTFRVIQRSKVQAIVEKVLEETMLEVEAVCFRWVVGEMVCYEEAVLDRTVRRTQIRVLLPAR